MADFEGEGNPFGGSQEDEGYDFYSDIAIGPGDPPLIRLYLSPEEQALFSDIRDRYTAMGLWFDLHLTRDHADTFKKFLDRIKLPF